MVLHRPGHRATSLLAVAAVAAGLAASLGAGYTAAKATLGDASTYVAKGDAISHVNGESRQVDATSPGGLAKDLQDVDATPLANGKVIAVNRQTGKISVIDGSTYERRTAEKGRGVKATPVAPVVVASGRVGWLLDYTARTVRLVGGGNGDGKRIRLDGKPVDGAPGRDGALIVLTESGKLYEVGTNGKVRDIQWPDARGAALTVAGGHSYLVQVGGDVVEVDSGTPVKAASAEGATGLRDGRMLVNSQQTGGKHVLIVQADQVSVVDPAGGTFLYSIRHRAKTTNLGKPVEYRNRIYLPNYDDHTVIVLDEKTQLALSEPIAVPGDRATFAVTVDGDRLWANDQYSNRMVEIDVSGTHTVDKGKGNGVYGDKPKPTKPTTKPPSNTQRTTPPTTTPPTRTPPVRPTRPTAPTTAPTQSTKQVTVPGGLVGSKYQDACSRVEQAQLRCQPVAAGEGGDTDDVIDAQPGSGTTVTEGTLVVVRYYGPTTVPEIPGATTTPAEQCRAVEQAKLTCAVKPADQPASSFDQFGYVSDSQPAPGDKASTGDTVTVTYYASFTMPQYSNTDPGTPGAGTCQGLSGRAIELPGGQVKKLTCKAPTGDKDNNAAGNAGAVYDQTPKAGQRVTVDQPITLTTYAGEHKVADYAANGGDAGAAQTDCRKWFTGCELTKGDVPVGHAQDAGHVQKTQPGSGTTVKVGERVDIIVWNDQTTVPTGLAGLSVADACNRVTAAGLTCDPNSSHPRSKQVNVAAPNGYPVSPAEGSSVALGSTVVVPNANTQPVNIFKYHSKADKNVWVLRVEGDVPDNYDPDGKQVTTGYRRGDGDNGYSVRGFYCSDCFGHAPNHYVTLDTKPANDQWTGGGLTGLQLLAPAGGGTNCSAPGTAPIWRVTTRDQSGGRDIRTYDIQSNPQRPDSFSTEFLGCGLA